MPIQMTFIAYQHFKTNENTSVSTKRLRQFMNRSTDKNQQAEQLTCLEISLLLHGKMW